MVKRGRPGPPRVRTALVVSADPDVRGDWAGYFEGLGLRSLACAGPSPRCALLEQGSCPLLQQADVAVYDRSTLTPQLTLRLVRTSRAVPIAFARDQRDEHGHHQPLVTGVASRARTTACIGIPGPEVGR